MAQLLIEPVVRSHEAAQAGGDPIEGREGLRPTRWNEFRYRMAMNGHPEPLTRLDPPQQGGRVVAELPLRHVCSHKATA